MIKVNMPIGKLLAYAKGIEAKHSGIEFGIITESGDIIYIGMIEYDSIKEKLQIVIYNYPDSGDIPNDIIELDNVMKNL